MNFFLALILVEALCVIGVIADYYLKIAGEGPTFINIRAFSIGIFLQASTAFGWFFVLKYLKLYQVGVFFSISIVVLLTLVGVYQFNETLTRLEIVGLVLAVASLLLLGRFA